MPKILRIINRFNLGGPTYNVAYLSKYLAPDYETLLVGGVNSDSEACSDHIINKLGLHTLKIPDMQREINGYSDMVAYQKIKEIIKRYKPDIVHTHASKAGFIGRYAAKQCNVPVILHTFHGHIFHSYFSDYKTAIFKMIERNMASHSSAIIAISNLQKEELCNIHKIAPAEKFRVIPLGFDLDRFQENYKTKREVFRNLYKISDDEVTISIIGRLVPIKNHTLFIKSFAKSKEQTTRKIRGFIVGDGELRKSLTELAESLKLTCSTPERPRDGADIIFTSWINDADIVLAGSDITALTSFNEGTPVSLIEAQAANTPIISTNVGGIEDIVISGKTALLAENDNVDDFSGKLVSLVEDETLRKDMAHYGWEFVKNRFHYSRLVRDMKELYDELLLTKNRT
ncbi:MAG: glycosyltransferase [Bacteroidales bacterium]|jgi:glycosyltransferase involved in cell wall biosynthesis|nr:glycosyltransferase [Bacteroidales bacterium]